MTYLLFTSSTFGRGKTKQKALINLLTELENKNAESQYIFVCELVYLPQNFEILYDEQKSIFFVIDLDSQQRFYPSHTINLS